MNTLSPDFTSSIVADLRPNPRPLERRPDRKSELERLLRLQLIVEDALSSRIVSEDEPERDVQHRHEETDFSASRGLEILPREVLSRPQDCTAHSPVRGKPRRAEHLWPPRQL